MHQKGYRNMCMPRTTYRWKKFRTHQKAPLMYANQTVHRHKDAARRVYTGIEEDRFLLHSDSHLARMMVQCTDDIYAADPNSTWRRTFIRNISPRPIRVANWPHNNVPPNRKAWTERDWAVVGMKWPVACFGLSFAVSGSRLANGPRC
jgi:hypothetical protein